ncbi:MAG: hypothetical protein ACI4Q8_07040 [Ruminococcus sp.]
MKKLVLITGIIIYTLFSISAVFAASNENTTTVEPLSTVATETETATEKQDKFVVKSHKGRIVAFDCNTNEMIMESDTLVSNLPREDAEILKSGIYANSRDELRKILEDYCS